MEELKQWKWEQYYIWTFLIDVNIECYLTFNYITTNLYPFCTSQDYDITASFLTISRKIINTCINTQDSSPGVDHFSMGMNVKLHLTNRLSTSLWWRNGFVFLLVSQRSVRKRDANKLQISEFCSDTLSNYEDLIILKYFEANVQSIKYWDSQKS